MKDITDKQKQARIGIRCGWVCAILSILGTAAVALWVSSAFWIDVAILVVMGVGVYLKSRVAAWLLLLYFMASKYILWSAQGSSLFDTPAGLANLFVGMVFLCLFGAAAWGTMVWQREARSQAPLS
ncbi:MAG: hypothetical protein KA214_02690 [Neisseriaceae bacterium]|nr:hypothetical protein [Neisseriaceae bacterium]